MTSTIIATTGLQTTWFLLISILWLGYFVLEGFDFGVGMLVRAVGKDTEGKRAVIHTIGPVWDANEVWVLTAGGATFAAFPELYATLFSAAYLALFLILFALIARGVAFEFWGKAESDGWRATWEWALILGSAIPALLWGVAWANIIAGLPTKVLDGNAEFAGTLLDFLNPYGLMGGVVTLVLFLALGAVFLTLRTHGEVHDRAEALAKKLSPAAVAVVAIFAVWTIARQSGTDEGVQILSAISLVAAAAAAMAAVVRVGNSAGQAFGATAASILLLFIGIFIDVFPNAIVGQGDDPTLTLSAASSTPYTLKVMTVVAVIFVPIVLAYQAWTYWVFRARIGAEDFGDVRSPLDLLAKDGEEAAPEPS
mgnify:CR=1 FL=1